jgi:membrane peptidoglycan carboxypeptidase
VSNPDFSGSYGQNPAGAGSSAARSNGSHAAAGARGGRRRSTDSGRDRPDGYDGGGNGRSNGSGYQPGDDRLSGYDRGANGSRSGYGAAAGDGFDRADGGPRGGRRATARGSRSRGAAASASGGWDSQGQGASLGQGYPASRRGRVDPRAKGAGARDLRDRLAIKARLAAITGTTPAVGRDLSDRAGARPGPAYRDPAGQAGEFDSFENIVGYRAGARTSAAALRERVDAPRRSGASGAPGHRAGRGYPPGGGSGGGRDGGAPPRRKGSWWRHWTWKKALAVAGAAGATMLLLMITLILLAYRATTIPTEVSETALQQSSNVYFSNGKTMIGTFSTGTNRQLLTSAQIPTVLKSAVIAAEDRHFYTEGGVSPAGILRAAYEDLRGGGTLQGGSTITQQFVRNYYANIGTQQTMSRKIKEIFVAIKLSHTESKDWILTQYLNTVYLGDSAYGVGAAAQIYFNKPAAKLSVAQSAMLAAMINEPGYFSPDPHAGQPYQALLARWHYVLTNMVRDGSITRQQAAAQKFPKIAPGQRDNGWTGYRGYIMQAVESELENTYGFTKQQIYTRGLRIVTTFNESMMNGLYRAVAAEKRQMKADGAAPPWYVHIGAVLEKPGTGAIVAMYGGPGYGIRHCQRYNCDYNMAMQSSNQVGSSFKPYVLAAAVSQGMNVQNSVLNGYSPIWIPPDWNATDRLTLSAQSPPANPYGYWKFDQPNENSGPLSVPKAAAISSDPAFEDLTHRVGVQNVLDMARNLGVTQREMTGLERQFGPHGTNAGSVTVSLGQGDLTVADQANTFAVLAAGGQYTTPHVIAKLSKAGSPIPLKIVHNQALTPVQAADVDYALSFDNVPGGTAYPAAAWDRPIIAKTGTTNNAQSAFFIGSIPQYSLAVGMFTQNQSDHTSQTLDVLPTLAGQTAGGYGGGWPATIWHAFMTNQFAQLPVAPLPTPDYTGFTKWIQVMPRPKPKKMHPNPGPSCGPRHHHHIFGGPCPGPSPSPSPSCSPVLGVPCVATTPSPPGQPPLQGPQAVALALLAQPAEEAVAAEPVPAGFRGG